MARTITSVLGNSQRLDGGAMFGNAPRPMWEKWIAPDEQNRIPLACRCLLVRDDARLILFETGIGAFFSPAMRERYGVVEDRHVLLESLAALGVAPEQIDVVVLSHLHFDHAGGALTAYEEGRAPALVFPRATWVCGDEAWQRALTPHARDRASFIPELQPLLEATGRLERVTGATSDVLGPGYRFHRSEGHTPGLLLAEIDMPSGPIVFAADLIPGKPWVHVPITMGYDRYPERLIDEKSNLLADLVGRHGRLFFTHDPTIAVGTVTRDAKGRFSTTDDHATVRDLAS
ncbi:MAG: MBL fold metallo-hydrolase [Kofleriaceae bacterium]|nr:MAG: MBL fold metallo-hydrolase [Kofleriaceae bacterium]MBZ0236069.1 MBL fold metallo-hydrolase [Kofleriaceae bacterium]